MPELGEVRKGTGRKRDIWHACIGCGKERWVRLGKGQPMSLRCRNCASKSEERRTKLSEARRGEKGSNWKGGRTKDANGYMRIKLQPDDFYYNMTDRQGYALEHRLIYAQHLGCCLQPWDIVNHKNGKLNEKGEKDNNFSNLQLTTRSQHDRITQMEFKIDRLLKKQDDLMAQNKLLQWHIRELEERLCVK